MPSTNVPPNGKNQRLQISYNTKQIALPAVRLHCSVILPTPDRPQPLIPHSHPIALHPRPNLTIFWVLSHSTKDLKLLSQQIELWVLSHVANHIYKQVQEL